MIYIWQIIIHPPNSDEESYEEYESKYYLVYINSFRKPDLQIHVTTTTPAMAIGLANYV